MKESTGARLVVGASAQTADVEYATGFRAPDPVVVLARGEKRCLVVPEMEYGRALRTGRALEVFTPARLGLTAGARRRLGDWAVALARAQGVRAVTVAGAFPLGVARRLARAGIGVRVCRGELFPERAVKSREETAKIRESQQAAVIAMRAAVAMVAAAAAEPDGRLRLEGKPLTSERVRRRVAQVLLEHDCVGLDAIVAGGAQGADPHEPGEGPLRAHEAVVIDIFPRHLRHGYWGDLTRTVVKGAPPPRLRRMYLAVRAAQAAALDRVRPGAGVRGVHRAAVAEFERRGFKTERVEGRQVGFIHGTGHGVGLAIHEAPGLAETQGRLRAGNVVTVEPGLYYPGVGGVRIEDTVLVTPRGWSYLVPCEKRFQV